MNCDVTLAWDDGCLKIESAVDPIPPTNMGDDLASLLGDEDCQSKNTYTYTFTYMYMYIYISHTVIHIVIGNNPLSGQTM